MAAALTANPTNPVPYTPTLLTGSGFAVSTALKLVVTDVDGTTTFPVTTDGTGAFTQSVMCNDPSSFQANVYPASDAPLASLTFSTTD